MSREEILKALRAASGPNIEIDKDILEATGGCAHRETKYYCIEDGNDCDSGFTCLRCGKDTYGERVPPFTGSIDAAVNLYEQLLSGWRIRWQCDGDDTHEAFVESKSDFAAIDATDTREFGASAAIAICASVFAALLVRGD